MAGGQCVGVRRAQSCRRINHQFTERGFGRMCLAGLPGEERQLMPGRERVGMARTEFGTPATYDVLQASHGLARPTAISFSYGQQAVRPGCSPRPGTVESRHCVAGSSTDRRQSGLGGGREDAGSATTDLCRGMMIRPWPSRRGAAAMSTRSKQRAVPDGRRTPGLGGRGTAGRGSAVPASDLVVAPEDRVPTRSCCPRPTRRTEQIGHSRLAVTAGPLYRAVDSGRTPLRGAR